MTSARTGTPTPALTLADVAGQQGESAAGIAATVRADGERVNGEIMVSVPLYREQRGHGVGLTSSAPAPVPPPRPTVLARTLALAHRMQELIDDGRAKNRADVATKLGFSRARVTQIMNLLWLAPDIQEEILFSVSPTGRDVVTTRDVKAIVRVMDWAEQRRLWREVRETKTKQEDVGAGVDAECRP